MHATVQPPATRQVHQHVLVLRVLLHQLDCYVRSDETRAASKQNVAWCVHIPTHCQTSQHAVDPRAVVVLSHDDLDGVHKSSCDNNEIQKSNKYGGFQLTFPPT